MKRSSIFLVLGGLTVAAVVSGCGAHEPNLVPGFTKTDLTGALMQEFASSEADRPLAGTARPLVPYTKEELVRRANVVFASRANPFAMFAVERTVETGIRYTNILGKLPGYANLLPPPVEPPPIELAQPEPQPYRRLSGVYFGDTVSAIVEMGDGKPYIVSPGQRVGDTEWFVESIDAEKMILVRYSNKDPRRVVVRLETPPLFQPDTGRGGGGGGGGRMGGGGAGLAPGPGGGGGDR